MSKYRYWKGEDDELEDLLDNPGMEPFTFYVEYSEISVEEDILTTIRQSEFIHIALEHEVPFEMLCSFIQLEMGIDATEWYSEFQAAVSEALIAYEYNLEEVSNE